MIDLFGMSKETPEAQEPSQPPKPHGGSHGLWLSLLVLDSIFVIVFGGAVAAKVYQYWKTPALVVAPGVRRHPAPKAVEAPKPPAPPPAAAPATPPPAPAPAPEPPKPAAKRAEGPRPPKPSLLTEPPKPRSTPGLATSAAPAAASASPSASASTRAQPVVFKLHAPKAGSVQLVGAFIVHGGRKDMSLADDGTWSVKLYLNPGQYRYFFNVDKKKTLDPENPDSDRGASLLTVP